MDQDKVYHVLVIHWHAIKQLSTINSDLTVSKLMLKEVHKSCQAITYNVIIQLCVL